MIYRLDDKLNQIKIEYKATTNKPTPIDLTNHALFNLNGHDSNEPIYNHEFKINSDYCLLANSEDHLFIHEIKSVENTINDFRKPISLADRVKDFDNNLDYHVYFISNEQNDKRHIVR